MNNKVVFIFRNEEKDGIQQFVEELLEIGRLNEYSEEKLLLTFKLSFRKDVKD